MTDDDRDWDDEYDPTEACTMPVSEPEPDSRWFGCLNCQSELMVFIPGWNRNMIHGTVCGCGQAFVFDAAAGDHQWRGPMHDGPTTAPPDATKPRANHVRDAINANR